ncbi:glycosyltransferase [Flavobacterium sp. JP2137]|uniref:glycosyltransferase n=1 Tax=Flavobacterium sp. JP2137 TaxID=3414510 RepID=UPI003D2FC486
MKDPILISDLNRPVATKSGSTKKRILVAPLNWGLGHATRCIPLINALIKSGFEPVIASDGPALALLEKEFPDLQCLSLPSYKVSYAQKASLFKLQLIVQLPAIYRAIVRERQVLKKWIGTYSLDGVISDNRLGMHSRRIPCVFITHQLRILSGNTSWWTTKIHHYFIRKFNECWVPDSETKENLSGKLGHLESSPFNLKYIGALSRFHKKAVEQQYDLLVLLSGPEPQRTLLEVKLQRELKRFEGRILFVRGLIEKEQVVVERFNKTTYNYMTTLQLELALNQSAMVLCRSGYTTIMDLAHLGKKAFFIPTPGQYEQEYLAKELDRKGLVPHCKQDRFKIEELQRVALYQGLKKLNSPVLWSDLFSPFQRKRKF